MQGSVNTKKKHNSAHNIKNLTSGRDILKVVEEIRQFFFKGVNCKFKN